MRSVRGVSLYSNSNGTGRRSLRTVTLGAPVTRVISFSKNSVAPRVADMRRNRVPGIVRSGTCHA